MKVCFLANVYFPLIKTFSLDLEVTEENSGETWLPAASRIFLANQRGAAGDETKGQRSWLRGKQTFFFVWLHF